MLERWFAEFEFVVGMRNLAASGGMSPTANEVLALGGDGALDRYLSLGLDYVESTGSLGLREAVALLHDTLGPGDVQITTGASEAILLLLWALLQPGDNVVVEEPCYQSHASMAEALGAEVRRLPLREEDAWKPDHEWLAALLDGRTRAVFLNHPHNPSGSMLSRSELIDLIAVTERYGAVLVSDEVFRPIALDGSPMPSAADLSDQAVSIGDVSKPWGLGGLRVGWCATHRTEVLHRLQEIRDYTTMCTSAPAEYLAEIALRHSGALLAPRLAVARENLGRLADLVEDSRGRLEWVPPTGGYTAFARFGHDEPAEALCRRMATDEKVFMLPGSVFGDQYASHVRIGYGGATDVFVEGIDVIRRHLAQPPTVSA
jgi:aspartate/methionine/tyrosine aminotransferase